MMKMFHRAGRADAPAFWEESWNDGQLDAALRFCDVDPLRPVFRQHLWPGATLLEGGCGRGQYVLYYGRLGIRVIGLDFATAALHRLKRTEPGTRLCAADVTRIPLASESVDVYYSGGVVEHFEGGPSPALKEAFRVLRPNGVLLVSVPYLSPLRRLSRVWSRDRRFVSSTAQQAFAEGWNFWQYAFSVREFSQVLLQAGFVVASTYPYAILCGLGDLPGVDLLLWRRASGSLSEPPPATRTFAAAPSALRSALKRVLVSEDRSIPLVGPVVQVLGRACANMMLYVCSKSASEGGHLQLRGGART